MEWLTVLKLVLSIASYISKRVETRRVQEAFGDAILEAFNGRVENAAAARDAILDGRLRIDPSTDPNRRD